MPGCAVIGSGVKERGDVRESTREEIAGLWRCGVTGEYQRASDGFSTVPRGVGGGRVRGAETIRNVKHREQRRGEKDQIAIGVSAWQWGEGGAVDGMHAPVLRRSHCGCAVRLSKSEANVSLLMCERYSSSLSVRSRTDICENEREMPVPEAQTIL